VKDERGDIVEVLCTQEKDPKKRVDGTIHWVSAAHAIDVEVRVYDRLFSVEAPGDGGRDPMDDLNPRSLETLRAKAEPGLGSTVAGDRFQFERLGYFYADPDTKPGAPVFNRVVALKDSWAKVAKKVEASKQSTQPKQQKGEATASRAAKEAELSPEATALRDAHGLTAEAARTVAQEPLLAALMEQALGSPRGRELAKPVALLLVNEVLGEARAKKLESLPFGGAALVEVATLLGEGTISSAQAKEVLARMIATGESPRSIVEKKGLSQIATTDALAPLVDEVLAANGDAAGRYRAGNANVLGALVGMVMKKTGGRANAKLVSELLKQKLG